MSHPQTEDKERPVVTVLVAVYNAAAHLKECIESLKRQSLRNLQVICVDDASTDASWRILNSLTAGDPRFELIRLASNQGQAYARNVALKQAAGEFVAFLDSDDRLSDDALESAVNVFRAHGKTDAVLFRLVKFEDTSAGRVEAAYPMSAFEALDGREAFKKSLDWQLHGIYVARRSLYERFPFDDSCRTYSDDNTTRLHYYASREVRCCNGIYFYRQHGSSVTNRVSVRRFDYLRACESMKRQLLSLGVGDDILNLYENQRWLILIDLCMFRHFHHKSLTPSENRYGRDELKRVWANVERSRLSPRLKRKFGYCPTPFWWLFVMEEWCYFTLRRIFRRR